MEEEFRTCIENDNYSVSNFGRLRNNKTNKMLKGSTGSRGYVDVIFVMERKRIHKKIHRLVAMAFIPNPEDKKEVDHIDNNKENNNVYNLRWSTRQENGRNTVLAQNNTTGTKGVVYMKDTKRWQAQIKHNGKNIFLGRFKTIEEAIYARKKKANELFGEFVNTIEKLEEVIVELKIDALKIDTD